MAKAQNKVIAGDYNGRDVTGGFGVISLYGGASVNSIPIDKKTVEAYELITDEHRKSAVSGAARGLVGGVLLGPVGALAGGLSASTKGVYIVAVQFKDGKKSLLEVNDKLYKIIITNCFAYSSESSSSSSPPEEPSVSPEPSTNQTAGSSDRINRLLPKEDFAVGVNSVDSPMPGYEPRYTVNMNNRKLAAKAVSAIDSYLNSKSDIDTAADIIEECALNVSHEKSEENRRANLLSRCLESVSLVDSTLKILSNGNHSIELQMLKGLLNNRNELARCYLIDEKINVKRVSKKILDLIRGYINEEINRYDTSASLRLYSDTLDAYLGRTEKDDSPFNDDDVKQIHELAEKLYDEMPDSNEEPISKEELQAIAGKMADIVKSMPDAPSVDVYYKAKEVPAQKPEPQKEPELAAETSQDAAGAAPASSADEIRKYKELLDDGIITQEEFDAKKKQLLGL